jgi:V/A-type H+-transporting ATPase subunit G/H
MGIKSIEDIEKEIDSILTEAEKKRLKIIDDAKKKAREILNKPFPIDAYRLESEKIIEDAKKKADEIIRRAKEEAERITNIDKRRIEKAIEFVVRVVTGVE